MGGACSSLDVLPACRSSDGDGAGPEDSQSDGNRDGSMRVGSRRRDTMAADASTAPQAELEEGAKDRSRRGRR